MSIFRRQKKVLPPVIFYLFFLAESSNIEITLNAFPEFLIKIQKTKSFINSINSNYLTNGKQFKNEVM